MILISLEPASGTPPIKEPVQDGDFCNRLKVAGTGTFEVGVSVKDRRLALEYYNFLTGDGDLEMDSGTVEAQRAARSGTGNGSAQPLNLLEETKLTYSGKTPMIGTKYIHSKSFWGGIGAEVTENFAVTEMEREGSTFFASTDPASYMTDPKKIAEILAVSPVHTVGIETKNAFNGTWETDARMHKLLSKDVKVHESFTGKFEVQKLLKFHENPVEEKSRTGCDDIDC
ncbi:MAG: hypothetical protein A4E48_00399 [Methanosaeta sp. PtaU1.Bin060]|nr:MAG: hypothetical protein A4E48_00399 [Methanosaeta sp. PtaU1.Bin060]